MFKLGNGEKPDFIVFDLDYTLWPFWVDTHYDPPFVKRADGTVVDARGQNIKPYSHSTEILKSLQSDGIKLGVASRTSEIKGAQQLIDFFGWTEFFSFVEIFPDCKTVHFKRIPLPKGPWTRNFDRFPKNFEEESILQYKDTSKHHLLGYRLFKGNKISEMFIHYSQDDTNKCILKAKVDAAFKKRNYHSSTILYNGVVCGGYCECIGGVSGRCKHVFSILWQLLDYVRDERFCIPEDLSCTPDIGNGELAQPH